MVTPQITILKSPASIAKRPAFRQHPYTTRRHTGVNLERASADGKREKGLAEQESPILAYVLSP